MYRMIALTLIGATHFSVCTGGLLSATAALASNVAPEGSAALMSRAEPQDFVCMTMSPVHHQEEDAGESEQQNGCANGAECLDQAHHSMTDSAIFDVQCGDRIAHPILSLLQIDQSAVRPMRIAAGPPLFNARNHAAILVKRE